MCVSAAHKWAWSIKIVKRIYKHFVPNGTETQPKICASA